MSASRVNVMALPEWSELEGVVDAANVLYVTEPGSPVHVDALVEVAYMAAALVTKVRSLKGATGGGTPATGHGRWWVIHEAEIMRSLRQVEQGDSADVVLLELTANTEPGAPL